MSILQRCILRKLSSKKRSPSRNVVANQNSHIQLATRRKLSLFYHERIHRRERATSEFLPLDFLLVHTQFCQSICQARQLISHRRVCVNNAVKSINHFKVSPGDVVSFQDNEVVSEEIQRSLFCFVLNIMGQVQNQPIRLCGQPYTNEIRFLRDLHSTMQEADIVISKMTGSAENVRLVSHFAEHNKMKSHLYNFTWWVLNLAQYMTIPK
ncbi:hypothetical protein MKW92_040935 [Papaver armeniacum]|nr:hypothetical protein MKW92_040935 [Papaver armeniacum]